MILGIRIVTYAALLAQVDVSRVSSAGPRIAVELAGKFSAALIGVAGLREPAPQATKDELDELTTRLRAAEREFRNLARPVQDIAWCGEIDFAVEVIVREARKADLLIVEKRTMRGLSDTGAVVLRAGRPVLAVPSSVDRLSGQRIVVGWKDTKESRRAIRDAIPFLQKAHEVVLVGLREDGAGLEVKIQLDDLTKYLQRHQVTVADRICRDAKKPVGKELLHIAREEGADLIVAGAYGHSRLGEWVFGGVTRDLLADDSISCLLSH
jgi:nucleotide-binding universal stress UspA family protein